jgi:hypothetical protein
MSDLLDDRHWEIDVVGEATAKKAWALIAEIRRLRKELSELQRASEPLPCGHPRACLKPDKGSPWLVPEGIDMADGSKSFVASFETCAWCADLEKTAGNG